MGKNLKRFEEFINERNDNLHESALGKMAGDMRNKLLDLLKDPESKITLTTQTNSTPAPPVQEPVEISSFMDPKKMTGLDLLMATKVGSSLEDWLLASGKFGEATDAPIPHDELIDVIRKNPAAKEETSAITKIITDAAGDLNAVMEPNASLLPRSSSYTFRNKDKITWDFLKKALESNNYWRKLDKTKYNLVAIRNLLSEKRKSGNHFIDLLVLMSPEDEKKVWAYEATTVPGPMFMVGPFRNWYLAHGSKVINPKGLAIVQPGVYDYKIGNHRGYQAFVQDGKVTVDRYTPVADPKDATFKTYSPGNTQTGEYGINIHRASSRGETENVNTYSAGCLVFAKASSLKSVLNRIKSAGQRKIKVALIQMDDLPRLSLS
jgi:hypothetical protein